jgi:chromosome segregation ATPase
VPVQEAAAIREAEMENKLREATEAAKVNPSARENELNQEILRLKLELKTADAERLRLAEQVATLKTQARELKHIRATLEQRISEADKAAERAHVSARQSISSIDEIMRDRDAEMAELVKIKTKLEAEVKHLREALEQATAEKASSENAANKLRSCVHSWLKHRKHPRLAIMKDRLMQHVSKNWRARLKN